MKTSFIAARKNVDCLEISDFPEMKFFTFRRNILRWIVPVVIFLPLSRVTRWILKATQGLNSSISSARGTNEVWKQFMYARLARDFAAGITTGVFSGEYFLPAGQLMVAYFCTVSWNSTKNQERCNPPVICTNPWSQGKPGTPYHEFNKIHQNRHKVVTNQPYTS